MIYIETPIGNLDIKKGFGFGINISIAEMLDVSKKNTPYTKTIILDGTKENNKILGNLFDVNSDFTFFNPNHKIDAKIVVNGTTVINGFLQLLGVKKLSDTDSQGNLIQYSVKISDSVIDFFTEIKDKEFTDLDFSEFDQVYDVNTLQSSWSNTYREGFVYLPKYTETMQTIFDFTLSIFCKAYLLKIFEQAKYSIGGTFIDNPTFEKEIIPLNKIPKPLDDEELSRRRFVAHAHNPTTYNPIIYSTGGGVTIYDTQVLNSIDHEVFDNNNSFDILTNEWTPDRTGVYNLQMQIPLNYTFTTNGIEAWSFFYEWNGVTETLNPNPNPYYNFKVGIELYVNGVRRAVELGQRDFLIEALPYSDTGSTFNTANNYSVNIPIPNSVTFSRLSLNAGDVVSFKILTQTDAFIKYTDSNSLTGNTVDVNIDIVATPSQSFIGNTTSNEGLIVDNITAVNTMIPLGVKQTDFINDLISRYNLVIRVDKDNSRKLIIDSKDDYYNQGVVLDWTDKKDYSNQDSIKFLSELQKKEMLFTYAADDDLYNKKYSKSIDTAEIYGQKKLSFDNEFTKGVKKVESLFASTPLVKSPQGHIVPYLVDDKKLRVLLYSGPVPTQASSYVVVIPINGQVINMLPAFFTEYPYAGHFDNPINPTVDINFGLNPYYYYNELTTSTNNNQYNKYWRNTVNQLSESKLITSKFHLTEVDINFITDNLNAKIFVKDSYYRINKIVDYNPLGNGLTKVELVKDTRINEFEPEYIELSEPLEPVLSFERSNETTNTNIVEGGNSSGGGSYNSVGRNSDNVSISGFNNTIKSNSTNVSITGGSNNTIDSGLSNVAIIGTSDITVTESNTMVVGGLIVSDGTIKQNISTQTGDYQMVASDDVVLVDSKLSETKIYLPIDNKGTDVYKIIKITGATNSVIVDGGPYLINGASIVILTSNYETLNVLFTGTEYIIN